MIRKAKAVWIGFLAPVIMLWVWALVASAVIGRSDLLFKPVFFATGPSILLGGLVALIAYLCTSGLPMGLRGKTAWITVVPCLLIGWVILVQLLGVATIIEDNGYHYLITPSLGSTEGTAVVWSLPIAGSLVVLLPWCYWPGRGTRKRAILKAYRIGFAIPATPCVVLFVWMAWRALFVDLGSGHMAGFREYMLGVFALIGIGISVAIGWIVGIICANRWKQPSDK